MAEDAVFIISINRKCPWGAATGTYCVLSTSTAVVSPLPGRGRFRPKQFFYLNESCFCGCPFPDVMHPQHIHLSGASHCNRNCKVERRYRLIFSSADLKAQTGAAVMSRGLSERHLSPATEQPAHAISDLCPRHACVGYPNAVFL